MTTFDDYARRIVHVGDFVSSEDAKEIASVLGNRSMQRLMLKLGMCADGIKEQLARIDFTKPESTIKAVALQSKYQGMMLALEEIMSASQPVVEEFVQVGDQVHVNGEDARMRLKIGDM